MNFDIPQDMQDYLQQLDDFIEQEITPLQMENDNNRFFDHRREDARTDWERGGLPNEEWEALLFEAKRRADAAGRLVGVSGAFNLMSPDRFPDATMPRSIRIGHLVVADGYLLSEVLSRCHEGGLEETRTVTLEPKTPTERASFLEKPREDLRGVGPPPDPGDRFRGTFRDDPSSSITPLRAQIDHPVRRRDHVQVMLDDHNGIAVIAQAV